MSYLNRTYVDLIGHDFTQYVKTEEDVELFERMVEHEEKCKGIPVQECIHDVIAALNLGRELQGIKQKVYITNPKLN
jgi:hypothetical protein